MYSHVLPKLAMIVSTSLAQSNLSLRDSCSLNPCTGLEALVDEGHLLGPVAIAGGAWAVAALPVFTVGSRHRIRGIRSCLWVLLLLWMTLMVGLGLLACSNRIQAYVWVIHAVCGVLYGWAPSLGAQVIRYRGLQRLAVHLGVSCVSWYAWQYGPPLGITGWLNSGQAQCGWSVHLKACLGVDLALWALQPVRYMVEGGS